MVPTTAALLYRIHVEEIALRDAFGAEYADYSKSLAFTEARVGFVPLGTNSQNYA